jgi:hypothetical protein
VPASPTNPGPTPAKPPHAIPAQTLLAMVLTLARPAADAPDTVWQAVVQDGLDTLAALDPRDPVEAKVAIHIIAANAAALDAYRVAFEPSTTAAQALRDRAGACALTRAMMGSMRLLKQQRAMPVAAARHWGNAATGLTAAWQEARAGSAEAAQGGKPAEAEPEPVIRRLDEVPADALAGEAERVRRQEPGEPPLPLKPSLERIPPAQAGRPRAALEAGPGCVAARSGPGDHNHAAAGRISPRSALADWRRCRG